MALSHNGIAQHVKRITTKPNLHMEGEPSLQKVIESNTKSIRHTLYKVHQGKQVACRNTA